MMNGNEYLKTLEAMNTVLYIDGEAVPNFAAHPVMKQAVNALKATYDLASDSKLNQELHCLMTDFKRNGKAAERLAGIWSEQNDNLKRSR